MRAGDAGGFFGGGAAAPVTPIHFASLFPGAFQVLQTDLGLSYGAAMLPNAGNTSSAGMALSGSIVGVPIPVWITVVDSSGHANIYFDGLGVTPAMAGVTAVSGVPIALSGAGAGLSITPSAGGIFPGSTWKATCAGWLDQSGHGNDATQPAQTRQPVITKGLNGKPGLLFDGVDDYLQSLVGSLLSFPYQIVIVGRFLNTALAAQPLVGGFAAAGTIYIPSGAQVSTYNGSAVAFALPSTTAPTRFSATFTNSTSDSLIAGAASATGTNAGPTMQPQHQIAANTDFAQFGNVEIFTVTYTPPTSLAAFNAAINSPAGYGPGAIAV